MHFVLILEQLKSRPLEPEGGRGMRAHPSHPPPYGSACLPTFTSDTSPQFNSLDERSGANTNSYASFLSTFNHVSYLRNCREVQTMYCPRILFPLLSCFKGNFNKLQVFCPTLQKETIFSTVFLVEGGWGGEGLGNYPLPLRYLRPCPKITVMYTATKTPQPPVFGRSFLVIWEFYGNISGPSLLQLIAWNKVERCS